MTYRDGGNQLRTIYVAGGSDERVAVVRPLIDRLRAAGWMITHDWTHDPGYDDPSVPADTKADLAAAAHAVFLWWVMPTDQKSEGAAFEAGYALAHGSYIVASGPRVQSNVFATHHADVTFNDHEEALRFLLEMRG